MVHYHIGNALDDLGQSRAGIAHLEIARRLDPSRELFNNDTGTSLSACLDNLTKAFARSADGLAISPQDVSSAG